jgi:hypothetical protein
MRRFAPFAVVALLTLTAAPASALTVRDVIELTRAGLGDEILLALIDVDPSVFPIDTATLKRLKEAGVSERVIVAMVRSARTADPSPQAVAPTMETAAPPPAPEPQVVVIEHHEGPQIREVPVAVPVYIPVPTRAVRHEPQHERAPESNRTDWDRQADHAANSADKDRHKAAEPVYWGFGGTRRPDAWAPSPSETRKRH